MHRGNRLRRSRMSTVAVGAVEVQSLEHRQLPAAAFAEPVVAMTAETQPPVLIVPQVISLPYSAGVVTVGVSRSGEVTISGDAAANFVVVDISGDNLQVSGWWTGTKFRMAGESRTADVLNLPLTSRIRSVAVNLRGGDDTLRVRFQSDVSISRDFSVQLGDGDDFLEIAGYDADVRIGNDVSIDAGSGDDRVVWTLHNTASVVVNRDIIVRTGSGGDTMLFMDNDVIAADALAFPDSFRGIVNNTAQPNTQRLRAGRDIHLEPGIGDDQLTLLTAEAGRDITVNGSRGIDVAALGNVRAGRGLLMSEVESQALQNVNVVGTLTMRTGAAASRTVADQLQLGRLDVVLGGGSDKFALGENVSVRFSGVVNGSGGSNLLYSGSLQPRIAFRNLVPGLKAEETMAILSGILSSVPRPAWSIQWAECDRT
ncbi:MAG: hypothetical protein ACKO2L_14345 [Planctomycetaceae bacterium]